MTIEVLHPPLHRGLTARSVVVLEVHTKRFYCSLKWKEISSESVDLTKASCSSASSSSPAQESPYMDTCGRFSLLCANTGTSGPVTSGAKDWRQIFKEDYRQDAGERKTIAVWLTTTAIKVLGKPLNSLWWQRQEQEEQEGRNTLLDNK